MSHASAVGAVARNVSWLVVGELLLKGQLVVVLVILARGTGAEALGVFTVSLFAAVILLQAVNLGQVEVIIRETARRRDRGRDLVRASVRVVGRWAVVLIPVALAAVVWLVGADYRWTMMALLPWVLLRSGVMLIGAGFKGLDRMDVEVKARLLEVGAALPLVAVVALAVLPVWWAAVAFSAGGLAAMVWSGRRMSQLAGTGAPVASGLLVREGVPFLLLGLLTQLATRLDTLMLAGLGTAEREVGYYAAAAAPVYGLLASAYLLALSLYPTLSRRATAGRARVREVLAVAGLGLACGGTVAALLWWSREILVMALFGADFAETARLLALLAWVLPGASAMMLLGTWLAAWRRQAWSLAAQALVVAIAAGLHLAWIPPWGGWGAARAAVVTFSGGAGLLLTLSLWLCLRGGAGGEG